MPSRNPGGGALRDDTKNGRVADYIETLLSHFILSGLQQIVQYRTICFYENEEMIVAVNAIYAIA